MPEHHVYVLLSEKDGKFYTGCTSNLKRRLMEHDFGGVKSTRNRRPMRVIHAEKHVTKDQAQKRERFLKTGKGRQYILGKAAMQPASDSWRANPVHASK